MVINIQDDILNLYSQGLLDKLLVDKNTRKNIMWATDAYLSLGLRYGKKEEIKSKLITGANSSVIKNRAQKEMTQQYSRTRQRGEVFTPLWVCAKMCNYADEILSSKADWQKYVDARVLEITCGEAPFLVSRYDVVTGETIHISNRIGLLDRKLQVVNDNAKTEEEWQKWSMRAFRATYGYEFQGDNLLIARINLLMTFAEYMQNKWQREPTLLEYQQLIKVIVWNIWQMDGLQGTIPYCVPKEEFRQLGLFENLDEERKFDKGDEQPRCMVYNWLDDEIVEYSALSTRATKGKQTMAFDFLIGNPPYQEEVEGSSDKPIYNDFMDSVYELSNRVELITPARFLSNAGKTPKEWNRKMLSDKHFKVLWYQQDSSQVFPNTSIKGGVAITYRDTEQNFGAIEVFTKFDELRSIREKIIPFLQNGSITNIMILQNRFNLEVLYHDFPEYAESISSDGKERRIVTSSFEKLSIFRSENNVVRGGHGIRILGIFNSKRQYRWVNSKYIEDNGNLHKWKVLVPKSNGSGAVGEVLSTPVIGTPVIAEPNEGYTQTFIGVGAFETESEAQAALKYVESKFARTLLGILKITQDNPPDRWRFVPLPDFSLSSDIDWSKSISEIDQQLYKKYGLDETEIQFIESHVKEMV